jgi:predicted porin
MKSNKKTFARCAIATALGATLGAGLLAPAMAQTNVTVTGLVDNFFGSMKNSGDPGSTRLVGSGGLTTSWIGFKATEDLGGGLKARMNLTSFLRADTGESGRFTGDTMFSRDANVGLTGGFGGISIGRDLAPNFLPTVLFNPFGDSFQFSPLILHSDVATGPFGARTFSNSLAGDTGWSNEIIYTTPDFGGLTANFHYQLGEVPGNTGKKNIGINALYFQGPLALTAFYHNVKVNNPLDVATPTSIVQSVGAVNATEQKVYFLGGSYDFKVVKLFATYDRATHDVDLKDKTWSLGASVPLGKGKILAGWADTRRGGSGLDIKRDTVTVGYDYDMSKRTDLYALFMNDKVTNFSSANSLGLGIRHRF